MKYGGGFVGGDCGFEDAAPPAILAFHEVDTRDHHWDPDSVNPKVAKKESLPHGKRWNNVYLT